MSQKAIRPFMPENESAPFEKINHAKIIEGHVTLGPCDALKPTKKIPNESREEYPKAAKASLRPKASNLY